MPIFENPRDPSSEEVVAGRALQELATQTAGEYAASAVAGERPEGYTQNWNDVADQFHEQFPSIDLGRAQQIYQQSRDISARAGLSFSPPRESSERTTQGRIPIFGMGARAETNRQDQQSLERIRDGGATLGDYAQVREMQGHQGFLGERSNLRAAGDTIADSLAFGADMAAANLLLPGAGSLGEISPRLPAIVPAAIRGIGVASAMPGRAMESVSSRLIPGVGRDSDGNLIIGGDRTWGDAFRGYVDHQIEVWTEMSGEALLSGGGALINRIPGSARAQAIAAGLSARVATNPRLRSALSQFGYSNMLGEFLEERVGELARGATGVSDDFGLTGDVVSGRYRQALNQLAVEGMAFGAMQVGVSTASAAINRRSPGAIAIEALRRQGTPVEAAHAEVMAAANAIANGTATPEDVRPGPLRTFAESLSQQIEHLAAQGPSPGLEPADNAVPNTAIPDVEGQNTAAQALAAPAVPSEPSASPAASQAPAATQAVQSDPGASPTQQMASPQGSVPAPNASPVNQVLETAPEIRQLPAAKPPMAVLMDRLKAWKDVKERVKLGEPVSEAEILANPPVTVAEIASAGGLSAREADVFHKRVVEGRTLESIAADLNMTREGVRQIEKRGRSKAKVPVSLDVVMTGGKAKKGEASTKRRQEFPANMEGSAHTPEDVRLDPEVRAMVKRANAPYTPAETRVKLLNQITKLILKDKVDDANKLLANAGEVPLTPEDYRAISELSRGRVDQVGRETAEAAQIDKPATGTQAVQTKPAVLGETGAIETGEAFKAAQKLAKAIGTARKWASSWVFNARKVLIDFAAEAKAKGLSSKAADYAVTLHSRLHFQDRALAENFLQNGIATLQDGKWTRLGIPWDQQMALWSAEDLVPIKSSDLKDNERVVKMLQDAFVDSKEEYHPTRADVFMTIRHILGTFDRATAAMQAADAKRVTAIEQIRQQKEDLALAYKRTKRAHEKLQKMDPARRKATNLNWEQFQIDFADHSKKLQTDRTVVDAEYQRVKDANEVNLRLVSPETLAEYRTEWAKMQTDSVFMARATKAHDAMIQHTANTSLLARAAPEVHNLTMDSAHRMIADKPDYIETARIEDEESFDRAKGVSKKQSPGATHSREGSLRQIVPPLVTFRNRFQTTAAIINEQLRRNATAPLLDMNIPGWATRGPVETKLEVEMGGNVAEQLLRGTNLPETDVKRLVAQLTAMGASVRALFTHKPWSTSEPNLYWWRNEAGELVNWRIENKELYQYLTNQQGNGNPVVEMLRWASRVPFFPGGKHKILPTMSKIQTVAATAASPAFNLVNTWNPFRDPSVFLANTIDRMSVKEMPYFNGRAYKAEWELATTGKTNDLLFEQYRRVAGNSQKLFPVAESRTQSDYPLLNSTAGFLRGCLKVMTAGELGPRFLEFRNYLRAEGWTEERLAEEEKKAREAVARGGMYQDPIPFHIILAAAEAANEVTGPFDQAGILTREFGVMTPFLRATVASTEKAIRNWKTNAPGAAIALGLYLGARLVHFLMYKDEDWYKELSDFDRYNNFIINTPFGLRSLPGVRGFDVPVGGSMLAALEAMNGQRPDLVGLLDQSFGAIAPPVPLPPLATVAWQIQGNRDWHNRPIVPRRDEALSDADKLTQYQLPYALRQFTGGRGEALTAATTGQGSVLRGLGLAPRDVNPHRSVDDAYERLAALESKRDVIRRAGQPFPAEGEYQRLNRIVSHLREISQLLRGERRVGNRVVAGEKPSPERVAALRARQIELGRLANSR